MVNLAILAILVLVLLFPRARCEGTAHLPGILAGLTFFTRGRVSVVVWSHRPGRVYYRFSLAGGTA